MSENKTELLNQEDKKVIREEANKGSAGLELLVEEIKMGKDYQGLKIEGGKLISDFIKFKTGKLSTTKQMSDENIREKI